MIYRRQFKSRLEENRTAAYSQYEDVSRVLKAAAEELSGASGPDHLAERRLLRLLDSLDIEAEVSVFRDKNGRLRVTVDTGRLYALLRQADWLDKVSEAVGVRLCRPGTQETPSNGRLILIEAEPLAVSVGIASLKKQGETVSGDKGTYFKTEEGLLCVVLSDGMGSGASAARDSMDTVHILESFLRAGAAPETAMRMLSAAALLRSADH